MTHALNRNLQTFSSENDNILKMCCNKQTFEKFSQWWVWAMYNNESTLGPESFLSRISRQLSFTKYFAVVI